MTQHDINEMQADDRRLGRIEAEIADLQEKINDLEEEIELRKQEQAIIYERRRRRTARLAGPVNPKTGPKIGSKTGSKNGPGFGPGFGSGTGP